MRPIRRPRNNRSRHPDRSNSGRGKANSTRRCGFRYAAGAEPATNGNSRNAGSVPPVATTRTGSATPNAAAATASSRASSPGIRQPIERHPPRPRRGIRAGIDPRGQVDPGLRRLGIGNAGGAEPPAMVGKACRIHPTTFRLFAEEAMNQLNAHGPLADRGRDALGAATAYVTDGEYTGDRGFEVKRWARQRPASGIAMQIGARPHEPLVIQRHTPLQPFRVGDGARHQKHMLDIVRLGLPVRPPPRHLLEPALAFQAGDLQSSHAT